MLPEYVWDAGVLEGNPFTFPEVKTLLEGVTIRQLNPNVSAVHDSPGIKCHKLGESGRGGEEQNQLKRDDALDIDSER